MVDLLDDLLAPAQPARRANEPATPHPDLPEACHLCDAPQPGIALTSCNACGRRACQSHTWAMLGVCKACAKSERMARFHRDAKPEDRNWLEN